MRLEMRMPGKVRLRFRSLFRRARTEADMEAEFRFHLDQLVEEHTAQGTPPAEAERLARLEIGNLAQIHEECREMWRISFVESLWKDLLYAVRVLRRTPGFTTIALLTIALGIGANTAIFSVVDAILLQPLAYTDSSRIVAIQTFWTKLNRAGNVSGGDYPDLVAEPAPFAAATRYSGVQSGLKGTPNSCPPGALMPDSPTFFSSIPSPAA